jgi:predicted DNA-binding transcriptional regulator AlpA
MKRLLNVTELAEYLGVSLEYLRQWRDDKDFPKPIRGKLWDSKAIEQYLDKLSNLAPNSADWNRVVEERLRGNGTRALPRN